MKNIKEILKEVKQSDVQDYLVAEILLCFSLGLNREEIFIKSDENVNKEIENEFWRNFDEFKKGRPLAQIVGHKEFYGLDFIVNERVLTPRPETELVVDLARDFIAKELLDFKIVKVVDIGSGSGNIILALAKTELKVEGIGIEISDAALRVARINLKNLNLVKRVEFRKGDLFNGFNDDVNIVLANLPYIGTEKFNFVAKNVRDYEPAVALFGGIDGLDLYRRLFQQIRKLKIMPQLIIGEFGFGQNDEMEKLLQKNFNNYNFQIILDLARIPRVFVIKSGA